MTAKEYLLQIKQLNAQIKNVEDEIHSLREKEISIRASWPDGQPHGSGTTDPTGEMAVRLADQLLDLEETSLRLQTALWRKRNEILETLGKVKTAEHNRLLYLRYVQSETWEQIAVDMHYTYQWVAGPLHGNALLELEKILTVDSN